MLLARSWPLAGQRHRVGVLFAKARAAAFDAASGELCVHDAVLSDEEGAGEVGLCASVDAAGGYPEECRVVFGEGGGGHGEEGELSGRGASHAVCVCWGKSVMV